MEQGSFLIFESLDRFGRDQILDVVSEFTKVLTAGITIVTLVDGRTYSRELINKEPGALFGAMMVMMRANDESTTKAKRVGDAWEKKRKDASGAVLTSRVPGWLHVVEEDGKRRIEFRKDGLKVDRGVRRRLTPRW
ncbi:recombinase family protein [Methylobacterium tardum]|uniref:recombinase family protein n=1 Tax=Methylobacterium tardum TaxID=374432 RepID=UPI0024C42C82|nr:recombinase family protein [Methylobacterium tardum]